ncbi:WhiB family transcriptional regulator [Kitasatospora sp. NPDC004745]|uniref:WhiB family transcriptional regulator n=1 Tax=Kitasatospora sp. NPDC004745 TaxID=3364019 RepID=UPI00369135DB
MNWRERAVCRAEEVDTNVFFPISFVGPTSRQQIETARSYCNRCPVATACLEEVLDEEGNREAKGRYGVRGGLTPGQRAALSRKRRKLITAA